MSEQKKRHRWAHQRGGGFCKDCPCEYRAWAGPNGGRHVDYSPRGIGRGSVVMDVVPPCEPPPSNKKTDTGDRK